MHNVCNNCYPSATKLSVGLGFIFVGVRDHCCFRAPQTRDPRTTTFDIQL